jgi:hypothetical protein
MQNALYFPHIHVRTDRVMKSALLLWDQVEIITPWFNYQISYSEFGYNADYTKTLEHAHRLINREHVPSDEEKRAAHDRILDLATTPNLPKWFLKKEAKDAGFVMHLQKLFDDTWDDLSKLGIATVIRQDGDVIVPTSFGRATMTILAQCCAGNDTQLVTDSSRATDDVRQTTEIEERKRNQLEFGPEKEKYFSAVDTLNIVDVDKFTLPQLVEFRERELRDAAPYQKVFRQNYWGKLDKAAQEYSAAKNEPERKRVRERLRSELIGEFQFLKEELGLSAAETLFTVDTATLVTLGAAVTTGGALGIAAAAVAGTRSVLGKFTGWQSKKNAAMQKRAAAAYMYVFKNDVNAGKPLNPPD